MQVARPDRLLIDATRGLGRLVIGSVQAVGQLAVLLVQVVRALLADPQRRRTIVDQLYRIGYLSLPVVILTGLATGLVLAVQAYHTLAKVQGETMVGAMVNYTIITELGPVLTGLMLAGRVGSAIAAELGSMKVTEQLDALRVMGTDPVAYLVAPRFLACVLLLPMLTATCIFVGIQAADLLAMGVWQIDRGAYWEKHAFYVAAWDIGVGLGKSLIFGGVIALVACRKGLRTSGGASGVGAACTEGVVAASVLILVFNFVLTLIARTLEAVLGIV